MIAAALHPVSDRIAHGGRKLSLSGLPTLLQIFHVSDVYFPGAPENPCAANGRPLRYWDVASLIQTDGGPTRAS